ncbi:biotin/lipoate A/B protein ligase family protein [Spirulina major CS-329]|uniref:biotin/lipoate A/B protein ligase family protein n=1 Tax=Spirulina TaxID=1154 RepID=UPI00232FBCCE|nr:MULTISPECIES: biotin/lipoate A/B protein ligase family protein [Spirulina]MDB9496627.1 biotin/lipoate A/B protein ligase family protein [Spirulina subsalsa CS-330]MDB9504514.1 biotin/lipoate A/B protein ligase family protein [Spirulina major CS-329]
MNQQPTMGRIVPLWETAGAFQMALDYGLVRAVERSHLPSPLLRFYRWQPVAISLGYHQHTWPDAWRSLTWHGAAVDLVRRPTGGRAVLHQGDLCYSLIVKGLTGQRRQIYAQLCEFLRAGWRQLGVALDFGDAQRGYIHHPSCFSTATAADLITSTGYKLIGSAQLRHGQTILQQGSIRLDPDPGLFHQVFGEQIQPPALGVTVEDAIAALQHAAQTQFQQALPLIPLSDADWDSLSPDYQQFLNTKASPAQTAEEA